jgi:hypothetical protein
VAAIPGRQSRLVLALALLVMVVAALDLNIVNTAPPRMAGELGGLSQLSWVVATFMPTSTATTPLTTLPGHPLRAPAERQ